MTTQQRDTDFAHVRVGTTIGFEMPNDPNITAKTPYKVAGIDNGDGWFWDSYGKYLLFTAKDRWTKWGGYIISQPDEAAEAPNTDEVKKVIVRNSLSSSAIAAAKTNLGLDITNGQFLGLLWLAGCHPAPDEAAIRYKALEDAARVCDAFENTAITERDACCFERAATAIRQMKGAGV